MPVLMHDDTLDRTTNMFGALRTKLYAELAMCNCAAKFKGPQDENGGAMPLNEPLPSLEQVIRWARERHIKMIFDVKDTDKEVSFLLYNFHLNVEPIFS